MNNKYSVACITLVRGKYKINTDGICVVYRTTADSIRKFDSKSNRTADSIQDSIRTQKNDSQVPIRYLETLIGVAHKCDGQRDRRTDIMVANTHFTTLRS